MRVLVTGARGFIGKSLMVRRSEMNGIVALPFCRGDSIQTLANLLENADCVIHLAGENRPLDARDFTTGNADLTAALCTAIKQSGRKIPLILSSSTQAALPNPYGLSKLAAEQHVTQLHSDTGNPALIYRLPGVFGKWCMPNYNSVVATFCHNIANDLPINISDPEKSIPLVYVDDVIAEFLHAIADFPDGIAHNVIIPSYSITLGALAQQIQAFGNCRSTLVCEPVGVGLLRALYATYVSYLPPTKFAYDLPGYSDSRGTFVEMLKTTDSGQFSFFTAHPGITRGGHYHHSKTEKFLLIKGAARFAFRHILTNETTEILTSCDSPQIVETVPGWTHDITNIGSDELIVMLWANEIFDRDRPDTVACKVQK